MTPPSSQLILDRHHHLTTPTRVKVSKGFLQLIDHELSLITIQLLVTMATGKQLTLSELLRRMSLNTHNQPEAASATRNDNVQPDPPSETGEHGTTRKDALPSDPSSQTSKLKKPPPITPRRFNRFFSPRSSTGQNKHTPSKAARQLQDITRNAVNRSAVSKTTPRKPALFFDIENQENHDFSPGGSSRRKRRALPTPASSPPQSSPCKRARRSPAVDIPSSPPPELFRSSTPKPVEGKPIVRLGGGVLGTSGRILERSFGGFDALGRGRREDRCIGWQAHTSGFCTRPYEAHDFHRPHLPFCTTRCNTNSLIAIGDEAGAVSLIESSPENPMFGKKWLEFQPHSNAIIDMAFSRDDFLLATASGDQTARIIDMRAQVTKYILRSPNINSSVKQVRFRPWHDSIIATSCREGDIHIWDLRCAPGSNMVHHYLGQADPMGEKAEYASIYNTISRAHAYNKALSQAPGPSRDSFSSNEASQLERNLSVTAIAFLQSRPNLLLSGSEASTTVRLWDIRTRYSRHGPATPISTTMQPESHSKHRQYGINSLVLNTDNSRLYALSRDNTLYAYQTSHLILGDAPELSRRDYLPKFNSGSRTGLGPIYGFRHPKFHATSFYVKASLRPNEAMFCELIAVGSSDNCAVVFPTDESTFLYGKPTTPTTFNAPAPSLPDTDVASPMSAPRPTLKRAASSTNLRMTDTIPIFEIGSALTGGHEKEVTSLTWTFDGDLVSVGDDYVARRWREKPEKARELRIQGQREGKNWGYGWAEVDDPEFDKDD